MIPFIEHPREYKLNNSDREQARGCLAGDREREGRWNRLQRAGGISGGDDVFIILTMLLLLQEHTYIKTYQSIHFKCMQIKCQLYLNKALFKKVIHRN